MGRRNVSARSPQMNYNPKRGERVSGEAGARGAWLGTPLHTIG